MSRFCDAIITINHEDYGNAKNALPQGLCYSERWLR